MDNGNKNFVNNFQEETDKKKETVCEIGFWISILGLILSFFWNDGWSNNLYFRFLFCI